MQIAGITRHPNEEWMEQIGRSATQETWGYLHPCRYVLHDRDTKFCASFRSELATGGVKTIQLPAKSPNLNAFAERWIRSVKQECLSKVILFGEVSLSRVLSEYSTHYHRERNHQGKDNRLLFPETNETRNLQHRSIECRQRLGGLLKYYQRAGRMNIFTKRVSRSKLHAPESACQNLRPFYLPSKVDAGDSVRAILLANSSGASRVGGPPQI